MTSLKGRAVVGAFKAGAALTGAVPEGVGRAASSVVGRAVLLATPERRRQVERNLTRVLGRPPTAAERWRMVGETYSSYSRYYYDSLRLPGLPPDAIAAGFTVEGIEHIESAMAAVESAGAPGPILALPHLGGWEWAGAWIAQVRHWPIAAVAEALEPPELFEWFTRLRNDIGIGIIELGEGAAEAVAGAILSGTIMCLLCDRDMTGGGVEVDFFGEPTTVPAGPAVLALRAGAPLLPTAVYFTDRGVHGVVRPPVVPPPDDGAPLRTRVGQMTETLVDELEDLIRAAPEQWHLMQPNWPSDHAATRRR